MCSSRRSGRWGPSRRVRAERPRVGRSGGRAALVAVVALALAGCGVTGGSPSPDPTQATGLRYVALGDSYTIGTSVEAPERFPEQLVVALGPAVPTLELVANLGVNGYTSADVVRDELPALDDLRPEFVTMLIGVNDVVQGVPAEMYEANGVTILDTLLGRLPAERIVTVAIPDYTVTPAGADYGDPREQHDAIAANNAVMERLAGERGIAFVDIFDISLRAADDRSLVADDGLHPSGMQYGLWVDRLVPVVGGLLGR
jgi:acyl-CoA thioesterase-1